MPCNRGRFMTEIRVRLGIETLIGELRASRAYVRVEVADALFCALQCLTKGDSPPPGPPRGGLVDQLSQARRPGDIDRKPRFRLGRARPLIKDRCSVPSPCANRDIGPRPICIGTSSG